MDYPELPGAFSSLDVTRGQLTLIDDGKGVKAPENIIKTVIAARGLYIRLRQDHIRRIDLYAQIRGLIAGNPPYNPQKLASAGLSHLANFNDLSALSYFKRQCLILWNLLNESQVLCKFTIKPPYGRSPEAPKYAAIISRYWSQMVKEWKSFRTLYNVMAGELTMLGLAPVIWPDERDWRWRNVELSRFYVADQASTDMSQLTYFCTETNFTAQYLFEIYEQYKNEDEKDRPWNLEELSNLLVNVANSYIKPGEDRFTDFVKLQQRVENGDFGWDNFYTDDIRIISLLYKEYDGKWSHYMFHRYWDKGNFLFFADRQYECLEQVLLLFTASPEVATIHANKGIGHKLFAPCQATMQLDCSSVDGARWASTPIIQTTATGPVSADPIRFTMGAPVNIGQAQLANNTLGSNLDGVIGVSKYIKGNLEFALANSSTNPSVPDPDKGSLSDPQAAVESVNEFGMMKHDVQHFYTYVDQLFETMTIKMLHSKPGYPGYEEVKEWKENCIAEGVPEELFDVPTEPDKMNRYLSISASRVAGDGSTSAQLVGLQQLRPVVGSLGMQGRNEWLRRYVIATQGADSVDAYLSDLDSADEHTGGSSLAGVENGIMQTGGSPIFSLDNEHRAHVTTHLALMTSVIQALQQQQTDPIAADKIFSIALPHTGEHMQALAGDMFAKEFLQSVEPSFKQIEAYAQLNRKNAGKMLQKQLKDRQADAEKTQEVMQDAERKNFVAQTDAARKDAQVSATIARADRANEQRGEIMREKTRAEAANQRRKIELEANNKAEANRAVDETREDIAELNGDTPAPYDIEM